MSPAGSKDMCMISWSGRRRGHLSACHLPTARKCAWYHGLDGDEDTCLHVTYWQQGNVHGLWHRGIAGKLKFLSPVHHQEECMASWSKEDNDVSCVLTVERVYEIWGGQG